MRARMRSPRCNCSRCPAEYATDDPFEDVVTLFDGLFLSALLIPLLRVGLDGVADWPLSAVDAGHAASLDQSADLAERALSLGRDYIEVMGLATLDASVSARPTTL